MTTLFSKGKISRFLLYPIMATFFFLLYELVSVVIATYYCSLDFYLILHYEPLIIFCNEIGKCLGILIEIYVIKKRTKDKIFFKSELKKSVLKFFKFPLSIVMILGTELLELGLPILNGIGNFFVTSVDDKLSHLILTQNAIPTFLGFIIIPLLSRIILKIRIHRHHYCSFGIIIISIIYLIVFCNFTFIYEDEESRWELKPLSIFILSKCSTLTIFVFTKWIMEVKYISPFEIEGISGFIGIIIILIFSLCCKIDCLTLDSEKISNFILLNSYCYYRSEEEERTFDLFYVLKSGIIENYYN